jgi:hypothetical protein
MDNARHVVSRILNQRFLSRLASHDVVCSRAVRLRTDGSCSPRRQTHIESSFLELDCTA